MITEHELKTLRRKRVKELNIEIKRLQVLKKGITTLYKNEESTIFFDKINKIHAFSK